MRFTDIYTKAYTACRTGGYSVRARATYVAEVGPDVGSCVLPYLGRARLALSVPNTPRQLLALGPSRCTFADRCCIIGRLGPDARACTKVKTAARRGGGKAVVFGTQSAKAECIMINFLI